MRLLSYLLTAVIATVPMLWIEQYTITNPIWWTVVIANFLGNLFGRFEGIAENKKEKKDNE